MRGRNPLPKAAAKAWVSRLSTILPSRLRASLRLLGGEGGGEVLEEELDVAEAIMLYRKIAC